MHKARVMVVEDDDEIRSAMVDVLTDNDCDVVAHANGKLALDYLAGAGELPCVIFLDLMMPVMDGQAFRAAQLADPRIAAIPVVVISAYRDVEDIAERLRAATFIRKPPQVAELVSALQQYC